MQAKAALFDVFGTVVDWRRGVADALAPVFDAKRIRADAHAFADAWRAEYQPAMERVRSGARGYVPLDMLHLENLGRALEAFGLADAVDAAERAALNTAWERLPAWPDAAEGLAALRRGMIVAPCSNGSIALMVRLARHAGLGWDCVLGADIARAYKPDPAVYLASAEALGLAPGEVVMVAEHNDDLAAARALGFRTAFVPRPGEHGPDQTTDLAPAADWDAVAEDLRDLARRLGA
jgi:2-haloacid dehalogenase